MRSEACPMPPAGHQKMHAMHLRAFFVRFFLLLTHGRVIISNEVSDL